MPGANAQFREETHNSSKDAQFRPLKKRCTIQQTNAQLNMDHPVAGRNSEFSSARRGTNARGSMVYMGFLESSIDRHGRREFRENYVHENLHDASLTHKLLTRSSTDATASRTEDVQSAREDRLIVSHEGLLHYSQPRFGSGLLNWAHCTHSRCLPLPHRAMLR